MNFFFCMLKVCLLCWYWHFSELQIHCVSIQKQASKADYGLLKDIRVKRPRLSSSFFLCSKYIQNLEVNNPFPKGPQLSFRLKGENISRSWGKKEIKILSSSSFPLFLFAPPLGHHDAGSQQWFLLQSHYISVFFLLSMCSSGLLLSAALELSENAMSLFPQLKHAVRWGEGRSSAPHRYRASGSPSSQNNF